MKCKLTHCSLVHPVQQPASVAAQARPQGCNLVCGSNSSCPMEAAAHRASPTAGRCCQLPRWPRQRRRAAPQEQLRRAVRGGRGGFGRSSLPGKACERISRDPFLLRPSLLRSQILAKTALPAIWLPLCPIALKAPALRASPARAARMTGGRGQQKRGSSCAWDALCAKSGREGPSLKRGDSQRPGGEGSAPATAPH